MARIVPALQQLIDSGDVRADGLDKVDRRTEIEWRIRILTPVLDSSLTQSKMYTYQTVRATVERMNRRAGAGLPMAGLLPKTPLTGTAPTSVAAPTKTKPPKKAKKLTATKAKKPAAKPTPAPVAAPTPPPPQTNVFIVLDDSASMAGPKSVAAKKQLDAIYDELRKSSPDFDVQTCCFGKQIYWTPSVKARELTTRFIYDPSQSETHLYDVVDDVCTKAVASAAPSLIYLLTDGEPTGYYQRIGKSQAAQSVSIALGTKRITFACVGPKTAADFFRNCGIPTDCVRNWDGNDAADLEVVTKQAAAGVQQYSATRSAGKSTIDSFFVDVVKAGFTAAECRKQLADVTSTLRVRRVNKFDEVETFVRDVLGETYSPGCGYYQIYKAETLKVGRKIILRPRGTDGKGEDKFYTGPKVRELLGLPSDRDVKVEPKNLGEFIVYFQSASPNRKLTPDSDFLFDKSHVAGATAPTWTGQRGSTAAAKGKV